MRLRPLLNPSLTVAAAVLACLSAGTAAAAAPSCSQDTVKVQAGAHGPFACSLKGTATIIVGQKTRLAMQSMTVVGVSAKLTKRLEDKIDGTVISSATAQGRFAVVRITVTNHTHKPQSFDKFGQAELQVKQDSYSTSLKGIEADPAAGLNDDIEPGESETGDLVFDVPAALALAAFPAHAALFMVNFGDDTSYDLGGQLGVIVL